MSGENTEGQEPTAPFVPSKEGRVGSKAANTMRVASSDNPNFVGKTQAHISAAKTMRIVIPSTETQKDDVFLQVNGANVQIKRDQEVDVPMPFIEVLNNALMDVFTQTKRPDGEGYDLVPRKVMRFPYRTVAV